MPLVGRIRPTQKPIWQCRFTGAQELARLGGVITGLPEWKPDGLWFDGVNDYVTFPVTDTLFGRTDLTFKVVFTPEFAFNDGSTHVFFDCDNGSRYSLLKALGNDISSVVGNTSIFVAAGASAYWNDLDRNVLVMSTKSGQTNAWLNGSQFVTNEATAWTRAHPRNLYIGVRYDGSRDFKGVMHELSIYEGSWETAEAADDYSSATFHLPSPSLYLDMKTATEDTEKDGADVVTDGDMEAVGVGDWPGLRGITSKEVGTRTGGGGTQVLRVTSSATAGSQLAYQDLGMDNKLVRVRGWCRGDGTVVPQVGDIAFGTRFFTGTSSTTWQYFDVVATAGDDRITMGIASASVGNWVEYDDVTVVPTGQLINDGDMEMDGTAEWGSANATLSKVTASGLPAGLTSAMHHVATGVASRAQQSVLTVGRKYRVTGWARGDGTNSPRVKLGNVTVWDGTTSTSWQRIDAEGVPDTTYFYMYSRPTNGSYVEYTGLDIREVLEVTPDRSPQGHLVTLGDGRGSDAPTFANPGLDVDSTDDHFRVPLPDGLLPSEICLVAAFRGLSAYGGTQRLYDDVLHDNYLQLGSTGAQTLAMGGTAIWSRGLSNWGGSVWREKGFNVLVVNGTNGDVDFWTNGLKTVDGDSTAWGTDDCSEIYVGSRTNGAYTWDSTILTFAIYHQRLTDVQVRWLTSYLEQEYR